MLVGHNDVGYEPEQPPIEVKDLGLALTVLQNEIVRWFSPVMQGEDAELTGPELKSFLSQARYLGPSSRICLRGRVFWIQ